MITIILLLITILITILYIFHSISLINKLKELRNRNSILNRDVSRLKIINEELNKTKESNLNNLDTKKWCAKVCKNEIS